MSSSLLDSFQGPLFSRLQLQWTNITVSTHVALGPLLIWRKPLLLSDRWPMACMTQDTMELRHTEIL